MLEENDPDAYQEAADRVTAEPDQQVWVVQLRRGDEWSVAAVLPSYEAAQDYMDDLRTFKENCPKDAPEEYCRKEPHFRYGSRDSPNKFFEQWPPEGDTDE